MRFRYIFCFGIIVRSLSSQRKKRIPQSDLCDYCVTQNLQSCFVCSVVWDFNLMIQLHVYDMLGEEAQDNRKDKERLFILFQGQSSLNPHNKINKEGKTILKDFLLSGKKKIYLWQNDQQRTMPNFIVPSWLIFFR